MKRVVKLWAALVLLIVIALPTTLADNIEGNDSATVEECMRLGAEVARLQNRYLDLEQGDAIRVNAETIESYYHRGNGDARIPWFPIKGYTWSFQPLQYSYPDSNGVLWVCHGDSTGEVVAYTTAVFTDGEFDKVESYVLLPALEIITNPTGSYDVTTPDESDFGMYG